MVEIHAGADTAGGLEVHPNREVTAARFEQPPPRDSQGIPASPLTVARHIALDPTTVGSAVGHASILVRAAIRTRDKVR
jgi:hypothetical protein